MFTGLITDIGIVQAIEQRGDLWARIGTAYDPNDLSVGASIAHNGMCLTLTAIHNGAYEVEISKESIASTNIMAGRKAWQIGTRINLERALKIGDELGGHLVSGHVDGVAQISDITKSGESKVVSLRAPEALAKFIAPKGSVTLDGTSFTVNTVLGCDFSINIIAHTQAVTIWGDMEPGDMVNLEIDILARYVARLNDCNR